MWKITGFISTCCNIQTVMDGNGKQDLESTKDLSDLKIIHIKAINYSPLFLRIHFPRALVFPACSTHCHSALRHIYSVISKEQREISRRRKDAIMAKATSPKCTIFLTERLSLQNGKNEKDAELRKRNKIFAIVIK